MIVTPDLTCSDIVIMGSSNGKPVLRDDDVEAIMKTSGMSEDQVKRDFDIFVNQYPTGEFYIISFDGTWSFSRIEIYRLPV